MNISDKQREVLDLMLRGLAVKEAAAQLGIKESAAQRRLEEARRANDCQTTYQLIYLYGWHGGGS